MNKRIFFILSVLLLITSCGLLTKTRYTSGYKLNLEFLQKSNDNSTQAITKKISIDNIEKESSLVSKTTLKKLHDIKLKTEEITLRNNNKNETHLEKVTLFSRNSEGTNSLSQKSVLAIQKNDSSKIQNQPPLEPNAKWAGILFYGGLLLSIVPYIGIIGNLCTIAGFVLAIISNTRYHKKGNPYRGEGLALSVIIVFSVLVLLTLLFMLLFFLVYGGVL